MSALSIQPTYPIFTDSDGEPLENGYVWIGIANLDPQINPINVYWDSALTIPAVQPIRTLAGYPSNSGTPARLYVNSDYSIRVMTKNGGMVYSAPEATERYNAEVISSVNVNAEDVVYDPPFNGAVSTNVEARLSETISVKDFGAVGDGVADDTAAIQAAVDASTNVYFPAGNYLISNSIKLVDWADLRGAGTGGFLSVAPSVSNIRNTRIIQREPFPVFEAKTGRTTQVCISDMTLDGRYDGTTYGTYGVYGRGMSTTTLTNVEAFFFSISCIYFSAAEKNNIIDCNVQYGQNYGIELNFQTSPGTSAYGAYGTNIIGGQIRQSGNAGLGLVNTQRKVNVIGVIFESNGRFFSGRGHGIEITGPSNNTTIQGCWFEGNAGAHIAVGFETASVNTPPCNTMIRDCEFWSVFGGSPGTKVFFGAGINHTIENCIFQGGGEIEIKSRSDSPRIISCFPKDQPIVVRDVNDNVVPLNVKPLRNAGTFYQNIQSWTGTNCTIQVDGDQQSPAGPVPVFKVTPTATGLVRVAAPVLSAVNVLFHTFKTIGCYIKTDSAITSKGVWRYAAGGTNFSSALINNFEITKEWKWETIGKSILSTTTGTVSLSIEVTVSTLDPFYITGFGVFDGITNESYVIVENAITTLTTSPTPSVFGVTKAVTGGATSFTNFINGSTGQTLTIIADHAVTITDGTNMFLAGSTNFAMNPTDTLTLIQKADGKWYEISRSDNT
jgi:hypothetical protein